MRGLTVNRLFRLGLRGSRRREQEKPDLRVRSETDREAPPELGRGRVTSFRRFRAIDAPDLALWGHHTDVLFEGYNMDLRTADEALRWFDARQAWTDAQLYAVESLSERRVVGYIGLREIDLNRRRSVLGISFDPNALGKGYGTDSLRTFLKHYFETWRYDEMELDVAATNLRARRCYERCGFRLTGSRWKPFVGSTWKVMHSPDLRDFQEFFRVSGNSVSMLFYDMVITRDDWQKQHQENL